MTTKSTLHINTFSNYTPPLSPLPIFYFLTDFLFYYQLPPRSLSVTCTHPRTHTQPRRRRYYGKDYCSISVADFGGNIWCLLSLVYVIIIFCYDLEQTFSWSKALKEEYIPFDSNFFLIVLIVPFTPIIIVSSYDLEWKPSWSETSNEEYKYEVSKEENNSFDSNQILPNKCSPRNNTRIWSNTSNNKVWINVFVSSK